MKVLIKSAKILNEGSENHLKTKDILVEDNQISKIADRIDAEDAEVISGENLHVCAGLFDGYSVMREPGNEHKGDLKALVDAGAKGGFTDLLGISGSNPCLDRKAQLLFAKAQVADHIVDLHPVGTITEGQKGENITELFDMHRSGALAFSDGKRSIANPELLKRALLYVKPFNGRLMVYAEDASLANGGMINEGEVAANLGMKVRPALAEEITVQRNIELSRYTDAPIHLHAISSKTSVDLIQKAKAEGLKVTADVQLPSLLFSDESLTSFDTNYKVLPVLREESDRKALMEAVQQGVIDFVTSGHTSQDIESKDCEFDHAEFGMTSLETALGSLVKQTEIELAQAVELMGNKVRTFLGLSAGLVEEGKEAKLAVIDAAPSKVAGTTVNGAGGNNPMIGQELPITIKAVINKGQLHIN